MNRTARHLTYYSFDILDPLGLEQRVLTVTADSKSRMKFIQGKIIIQFEKAGLREILSKTMCRLDKLNLIQLDANPGGGGTRSIYDEGIRWTFIMQTQKTTRA